MIVAHLRFAETELAADRAVREREIVAAHVERRVEQADEGPVQPAARAKAGRMRNEQRGHAARENDSRVLTRQ